MKNWSYHHPWRFAGLLLALAAAAPIATAIDNTANNVPIGKNLVIAAAPDTSCPTSAALEPISITVENPATIALDAANGGLITTKLVALTLNGTDVKGGAALGAEQTVCVVSDSTTSNVTGNAQNGITSNIKASSVAVSINATASSTAGSPTNTVRFTNGPNFAGSNSVLTNNRFIFDQGVNGIA